MDGDDIVARLRAVLHNDRSVELMNREAADEIERLRAERDEGTALIERLRKEAFALAAWSCREIDRITAERDEARRIACKMEERAGCDESGCPKNGTAQDHATRRGWDCFKENTNEQL